MKRGLFMLLIALGSGLGAHALYTAARPEKSPEACTMEWLAAELSLSPAQAGAVSAIHERRCAEICRLDGERATCPADAATSAQLACRLATRQLIHEVCAQLTAAQREKYLRIVSPCLAQSEAAP